MSEIGMRRCAGALGIVLAWFPLVGAGGGSPELGRFEYRRVVMGTQARIVLYAPSEAAAVAAARAAFDELDALDAVLSHWRADSDLSRLCAGAPGTWIEVDPALHEVLGLARRFSAASGGAFDVTVGPLMDLWRASRETGRLPGGDELAAARARVGWRHVELGTGATTARLAVADMRLDLGALGKGYACDRGLERLRESGVTRALVDVGGDLVAGDPPPGRATWTVAIDCDGAGGSGTVELVREAVATSGDSAQHADVGGVRYSHVVDPRTGLGVVGAPCVTVVAPSGVAADALASAVSVLGVERSAELLAAHGARLAGEGEGAVSLFDGRTLDGWVTEGGRYDGNASWSVEDGAIVGREGPDHAGGLLYTAERYTSFDLWLETKIDHPFDSGIFLRMAPEGKGAQVTLDYRPDGEVGAIYSDGFLHHNATAKAKWREGEWNAFRVRCTGFDMRIQVWMNGELITDYALPDDSPGYAPTGLIGLQVHGARGEGERTARFRDLRLRELPVLDADAFEPADAATPDAWRVSEAGRRAGWRSLFDGASLAGWQAAGPAEGYRARGGVLELLSPGGGGHLATDADYRDFSLRLDFKLARMANSGLFLRAARDGSNPAFSGCEVQILDDFHWEEVTGSELQAWQHTGSLYGAVAPGFRDALRPVGEWNTYEVLYRGSRLAVALNGNTLYDVDTLALEADPPFADRAPAGFIGLQHHAPPQVEAGSMVAFRRLFIREH